MNPVTGVVLLLGSTLQAADFVEYSQWPTHSYSLASTNGYVLLASENLYYPKLHEHREAFWGKAHTSIQLMRSNKVVFSDDLVWPVDFSMPGYKAPQNLIGGFVCDGTNFVCAAAYKFLFVGTLNLNDFRAGKVEGIVWKFGLIARDADQRSPEFRLQVNYSHRTGYAIPTCSIRMVHGRPAGISLSCKRYAGMLAPLPEIPFDDQFQPFQWKPMEPLNRISELPNGFIAVRQPQTPALGNRTKTSKPGEAAWGLPMWLWLGLSVALLMGGIAAVGIFRHRAGTRKT